MNDDNKPGYYAVIPSQVRYCKELKSSERLLYGEITALLNKEGYCFASNRYFAELYNVIPSTVSRWISHLEKLGFIKEVLIRDDKKQIIQRILFIMDMDYRTFLACTYGKNKQYPYIQNEQYPIGKNDKDINLKYRIDRLFDYIINKPGEILKNEFSSINDYNKFCVILKRLEMNYTKESISIFTEENVHKIKIIIFCIKELMFSSKNVLIPNLNRQRLINIYDTCKKVEQENKGTKNENIRIAKIANNKEETIEILNNDNIDVVLLDINIIKSNDNIISTMIKKEKQKKYKDSIILITKNFKESQKVIGNKMIFDYLIEGEDSNEILYKINRMIISKDLEGKRKKIIDELKYIGYNIEHIGTKYLVDAILQIYLNRESMLDNLQKDVYPIISKIHNKPIHNIKCDITRATECMYYECDSERLKRYFGFYDDKKPTSKTVIFTVLNKI